MGSFYQPAERNTWKMSAATRFIAALALSVTITFFSLAAAAQKSAMTLSSAPIATLIYLGALTLIPFLFMATTSFVKISFVFSILRNALGTGQVPSGMVITLLATILTFYVMAPVGRQMVEASSSSASKIDLNAPMAAEESREALLATIKMGIQPLQRFLKHNAGTSEMGLFKELSRRAKTDNQAGGKDRESFIVILSAFLITELKEAFQIGFLVFLPFLIIDMVIANILLSLGMHMLSPTTISLPFKLLLFVLVNGWYLLTQALLLGYR